MQTIKTTVSTMRNQFGKPSGSYQASIGPFSAVGTSKDEACAILLEKLELMERHQYTKPVLVTSDGTVFVLSHQFEGWSYDIIHSCESHGNCQPSTCMMDCKTFTDAFNSMKRHWEQMEADCNAKTQPVAA